MEQSHTSKQFSADLRQLSELLSDLGKVVYQQVVDSLQGLIDNDLEKLARVRATEKEIDSRQHEINDITVRVLALRQPVGMDLRYLLVIRDAATEMERLGDYANNIAKWNKRALDSGGIAGFADLQRIIDYVCNMLNAIMEAYENNNSDKQIDIAISVIKQDDALDDMYISIFCESLTYTLENTKKITAFSHYMLILKQLERIGDLATNLAELLYYKNRGYFPSINEAGD